MNINLAIGIDRRDIDELFNCKGSLGKLSLGDEFNNDSTFLHHDIIGSVKIRVHINKENAMYGDLDTMIYGATFKSIAGTMDKWIGAHLNF